MKFLMKKIKRIGVLLLFALLGVVAQVSAQIPDSPNPPRLVNDFANIFTYQQAQELEDSLVHFSKKTSNQVTIVTVNDLGGMAPSQFAYELGEKWGVGGEKLNNGVVILIKPKNYTKGEVFIATGYGVEGALPDASCSRIINNEMIPSFKVNDYYGGVVKALNVILPVLANEYSIEEYERKNAEEGMLTGLALVVAGMALVFVVIILISKDQNNRNDRNGNSGTFGGGNQDTSAGDIAAAILLGSLLGGRSSGRSSGGFGGGSFGGGGFGGFGGGSFGGGGAGGSW